jgi:hypothetical protein
MKSADLLSKGNFEYFCRKGGDGVGWYKPATTYAQLCVDEIPSEECYSHLFVFLFRKIENKHILYSFSFQT